MNIFGNATIQWESDGKLLLYFYLLSFEWNDTH